MKSKWIAVAALILVTQAAFAMNFILDKQKAGDLTVGMSEDQVAKVFPYASVRKIDVHTEDEVYPALDVYLEKSSKNPSLQVRLDGGIITSFLIYDPKFKTKSGIGVGSTLGQLRKADLKIFIAGGEGDIGAMDNETSISFILEMDEKAIERFNSGGQHYNGHDNPLVADSTRIKAVYIP